MVPSARPKNVSGPSKKEPTHVPSKTMAKICPESDMAEAALGGIRNGGTENGRTYEAMGLAGLAAGAAEVAGAAEAGAAGFTSEAFTPMWHWPENWAPASMLIWPV